MLQMTLHLTRLSRLWTTPRTLELLLLRSEKKATVEIQRRDFRPLEDKHIFLNLI
jgi:hypothetical protein